MKYRSLFIIGSFLLAACAPTSPNQMGNGGMMHGDQGMMGGNQAQASGFLPGQGKDIASLPEAKPTSTIDVQDGQTITLNPTLVRKTINSKEIAMYGYNGEIPGPLLRVKQGSTF